jgi:hypothetical protein
MTAYTLAHAAADLSVNLDAFIPTVVIGPVGVGKTDLVRQCAAKRNWPVIDKRASQMDATDVQLPMPDTATGLIATYVPAWLPIAARDGNEGILMLDELTDASLSVQAALNQLILERELPGYRLPEGWRIVATGNRGQDKAAAQKISRAMSNRLAIIEIEVDVAAWLAWAVSNVSPILVAYIQSAAQKGKAEGLNALHRYPEKAGSDAIAFVTPRSLARCDKYLRMNPMPKDTQLRRLFAQNIGEDNSDALMNFLATYRLAPNVDAIMIDPMNVHVPHEPSINYAIGVGLVSRLTMANIATIATYIKRVDSLYQAAFWSLAIAKDDMFRTTAEHVAFKINQDNAGDDIAA